MSHEAREGEGDEKGEECGEVGVHELSCDEFPVLTQNAAFQRGTTVTHQGHCFAFSSIYVAA